MPAAMIAELNLYVSQLTSKQKASAAVKHALAVQRALALGNYHAFFEYYLSAPNMGAYIMDHFVDRERLRALLVMTKACVRCPSLVPTTDMISLEYRYQRLSVAFILQELAFDNFSHVRDFLMGHRAVHFVNPNSPDAEKVLDCKVVSVELPAVLEEKYSRVQIKGAI
jgi:SAC3 family protein LENG8/THP3